MSNVDQQSTADIPATTPPIEAPPVVEAPPPPTKGLYHSAGEGSDGLLHNLDGDRCLCDHRYAGEPIIGENDAALAGLQPCRRTIEMWMRPGGARSEDPAITKIATVAGQAMVKQNAAREPVPFSPKDTGEMFRYAQFLAGSNLIPKALQRNPNDVLVVLLKGQSLGLDPMQSISGINVIDGKAEIGALMMVSLVRRSGLCEEWRLVSFDDKHATYYTKRRGDSVGTTFTYTIDEAHEAGLTSKGRDPSRSPWNTQRRVMLRRRAQSFLAREVYSDVVGGYYDHGELQEMREIEMETIRLGHEATRAGFAVVQGAAAPDEPDWMAKRDAEARPAEPQVQPKSGDPMKDRLRQRAVSNAKDANPPAEPVSDPTTPAEAKCSICKDPIEPPAPGQSAICFACARQ